MKKIYKIAMLLAAVALSSCTIEIIGTDGPGRNIDGPRTIAVSFAPQSKTALRQDGVTPEFKYGDEILVSNGKYCETLSINFDHNGGASFTTELSGPLTAVYPPKAAKLDGTEIIGVLVPSNQTGRFKDANIAMAKISEGAAKAIFENQTAILKFYVDESIGVMGIGIFSNEDNICDGYIDEEGNVTQAEPNENDEKPVIYTKQITVEKELEPEANYYQSDFIPLNQLTDDPQGRVCYVAIRPTTGTQTYNLRIVSRTTTQTANNGLLYKSQQAIGQVQREFSNVSLPANTLANVFIPYYIQVDDQKWAYCNLGAFLPEETGEYFAWGDLSGAKYLPEKGYTNSPFFKGGSERLFSWQDCPFNGGKNVYSSDAFKTFKDVACPNGVLSLDYDAAHKAWGDKWRIPTKDELEKLLEAGRNTYKGGNFIVNASLCLPVTGNSFYNEESNTTTLTWDGMGMYWSSSLCEESTDEHESYCFEFGLVTTDNGDEIELEQVKWPRHYGLAIRPIYKITGLTVESYQKGKDL